MDQSGENNPAYKHGDALRSKKAKEYRCWSRIKDRCYREKSQYYYLYGGRGIKVCDRWLDSYDDFLSDMGRAPTKKHSIERIDSDGDYCPDNCKWATHKEQANNQRTNKNLTYKGRTQNLMQWSEELGFNYNMVKERLRKGWDVVKAFEQKKSGHYKTITIDGETKTLSQWACFYGLDIGLVARRISQGWSVEKTFSQKKSGHYKTITIDGETKNIQEWAKIKGLTYYLIHNRMKRGWSGEEAVNKPVGNNGRNK